MNTSRQQSSGFGTLDNGIGSLLAPRVGTDPKVISGYELPSHSLLTDSIESPAGGGRMLGRTQIPIFGSAAANVVAGVQDYTEVHGTHLLLPVLRMARLFIGDQSSPIICHEYRIREPIRHQLDLAVYDSKPQLGKFDSRQPVLSCVLSIGRDSNAKKLHVKGYKTEEPVALALNDNSLPCPTIVSPTPSMTRTPSSITHCVQLAPLLKQSLGGYESNPDVLTFLCAEWMTTAAANMIISEGIKTRFDVMVIPRIANLDVPNPGVLLRNDPLVLTQLILPSRHSEHAEMFEVRIMCGVHGETVDKRNKAIVYFAKLKAR